MVNEDATGEASELQRAPDNRSAPELSAPAVYSGSWYNPDRNYEGFEFQMLDNGEFLIIFYTYPGPSDEAQAEQSFILGVGSISGTTATINDAYRTFGPVFGENYNKDDLEVVTWGDFTVEFQDDNNAVVTYDGLDGAGSTTVTRLTGLVDPDQDGNLPSGMSAIWFDPETNGQGWFVEFLSSTLALVYWFTYDENGNQAWSLGMGNVIGTTIQVPEMLAGKGTRFGQEFNSDSITLEPAGLLSLDYSDCNSGQVSILTADGTVSLSYPVVRLTALLGHDCAGFPGLEDGELTVMSNTTDPLLTRYKDPSATIFDVFGSSDSQGENVESDGALTILPDEETVRMDFDEASKAYEMTNPKTGIRMIYREYPDGSRTLTVINPETGNSVTVPLASDNSDGDSQGMADNKATTGLSTLQAAANRHQVQMDGGQIAEIVVDQCGGPSAQANVDFVVGDRTDPSADPTSGQFRLSEALMVPAQVVGSSPRFEALIPIDAPEFSGNALNARCSQIPSSAANFCELSQTNDQYCAALIEASQGELSDASPEELALLFETCNTNRALAVQFCSSLQAKQASQCTDDGASVVYREARSDIWAGVSLEGVTQGTLYTSPQSVDPAAEGYNFGSIELPSRAILIDAFTVPGNVTAGDAYQAHFYASCLGAGVQLTATRLNTAEQFTCQIDSTGRCIFDLPASDPDTTEDVIEVTGPNQFQARLTVGLEANPNMQYDLNGTWQGLYNYTDTCEPDESISGSVQISQTGNAVEMCGIVDCLSGTLNGNQILVTYDGITIVFTVSNDGNSIYGEYSDTYSEGPQTCTFTESLGLQR